MTTREHTLANTIAVAGARLGVHHRFPMDTTQDFDEAVWELEYGLRHPNTAHPRGARSMSRRRS